MITVRMWPEENTRTPEKSCFYTAETTIDGVTYSGPLPHGCVERTSSCFGCGGRSWRHDAGRADRDSGAPDLEIFPL